MEQSAQDLAGYEVIAGALRDLQAGHVFGVMGNGNLPWIAHGAQQRCFEYVSVRHEAAAVNAAAGYARARHRVGYATVTHGPGLTNAMTALVAAVRDRAPVVLIAGMIAPDDLDNSQALDQQGMVRAAGAGYLEVASAGRAASTLARAAALALSEGGPQVVAVRSDFLFAPAGRVNPITTGLATLPRQAPTAEAVDAAVELLAAAKRPVILAGQGATWAGALAGCQALGDRVGALFAESLMACHFFSSAPQYRVGLSGGLAHPLAAELLRGADVVVGVGVALNKYVTYGFSMFANAAVIQLDSRPRAIGVLQPVDVGVVGDAALSLDAIVAAWDARGLGTREGYRTPEVLSRIAAHVAYDPATNASSAAGLDPRPIYAALDAILPADRMVVAEGGRVSLAMHGLISAPDSGSYLWSSGFGSIGHGLQTAVGVSAAAGDRVTMCVAGDGGFLMSTQELDTLARRKARVLVVVMNDGQFGMEVMHLTKHGMPLDTVTWTTPDLAELCRGYGGSGRVVRSVADLDGLAEELAQTDQWPVLLDVRIDPSLAAH